MSDVLSNAFTSFKNFVVNWSPFGNDDAIRRPRGALEEVNNVNGGVNHHRPSWNSIPKLFSTSRKRPLERVIEIEREIELTDDEDASPPYQQNSFAWTAEKGFIHNNFAKRFKASYDNFNDRNTNVYVDSPSNIDDMMSKKDEMGRRVPPPSIPGLEKQPWEFSFPSARNRSKTPKNSETAKNVDLGGKEERPSTSGNHISQTAGTTTSQNHRRHGGTGGEAQTDFSSFRFTHKPPEVITIKDDEEEENPDPPVDQRLITRRGSSSSSSSSPFLSDICCDRKKKSCEISMIQTKPISKPRQSFMSCLSNVGKKAIDPIATIVRLEERNVYRNLIQKMTQGSSSSNSSIFGGRHLEKSKVNHTEVRAIYHNWKVASPRVSLSITSSKNPSRQTLSDRVKQDLRLFSTPTASRSSGSTPLGPTSPPVLVDLEDEEKEREKGDVVVVYQGGSRDRSREELSLSTSFADLEDALSSTRFDNPSASREKGVVSRGEEEEEEDQDITILSESILHKYRERRVNSLALEQNLSPYVKRTWLNGLSTTFRDNQKRRDKEIQEHLETVDVLNTESTLEKDLRDDIRRKLTLTEIIVLEEPPPKLPQISDDMMMVIDSAKRPGRDNDVLAKIFNIDFIRADAKTLAPSKWLNDNVINVYMELIAQRSKQEGANWPKVYPFTTFFYPKLLKEGYSNALKRWTRKVDLFGHDQIMFPIHLGLHWCLACADLRQKTISYYDSLGGKNNKCLNALLNYLAAEMKERKGQVLNKDEWLLENVEDVPQQQNGSDCGVFTCKFAEYLSRDANLTFVQENMNYYRERMIYEIIEKDLMFP